jgi:hypothetical protein
MLGFSIAPIQSISTIMVLYGVKLSSIKKYCNDVGIIYWRLERNEAIQGPMVFFYEAEQNQKHQRSTLQLSPISPKHPYYIYIYIAGLWCYV